MPRLPAAFHYRLLRHGYLVAWALGLLLSLCGAGPAAAQETTTTPWLADSVLSSLEVRAYDVCHFALAYEAPATVLARLRAASIKVGRVQLSAALKADLPADPAERQALAREFEVFAEGTYLHQVVVRNADNTLTQYPDLPAALLHIGRAAAREWRAHFHVPVFLARYQRLESTQAAIREVLALLVEQSFTPYLDVETYT